MNAKRRRALITLVAIATLTTGCGGGGVTPPLSPAAPPPTPPPPAPVPTGLHVSATAPDSITWTWNTVEGATAYEVQISVDEVFNDTDAIVTTTETSYTATGLSPESGRHLRVRAVAGTAEAPVLSAWSSHVAGTSAMPPPPLVPTGLQVSATAPDSITWTWIAVDGATAYEVQVSADEVFDDTDPIVTTTETSYTVTELSPESERHLRVRAFGGTAQTPVPSAWSSHVTGLSAMSSPSPRTVSFVEDAVRLVEGEVIELLLPYQVSQLPEPVNIEVSVLEVTAGAEDYELSATMVEIPAGENVRGETSLRFAALADRWFAEGEETLEIRLVPPPGLRTVVDPGIEVTIAEAGVSPCPTTVIRAAPPSTEEEAALTTFFLEFTDRAGRVAFDWIGPYDTNTVRYWTGGPRKGQIYSENAAGLHVILLDWKTQTTTAVVSHTVEFAWPAGRWPGLEAGLRFRSDDGACSGEPTAVCTDAGCELRQ